MAFDQAAHDRQAEAEPALRPIEDLAFLNEQVEHPRQHVRGDAGTGGRR